MKSSDLESPSPLLQEAAFTKVGDKGAGLRAGFIGRDAQQDEYMVKSYGKDMVGLAREYIGSKLMGAVIQDKTVPRVRLVQGTQTVKLKAGTQTVNTIKLASRMISGFTTLATDHTDVTSNHITPANIKAEGFESHIVASAFIRDYDWHRKNKGKVQTTSAEGQQVTQIASLDFDKALAFNPKIDQLSPESMADTLMSTCKMRGYSSEFLRSAPFMQSVERVSTMNPHIIDSTIRDAIKDLQQYGYKKADIVELNKLINPEYEPKPGEDPFKRCAEDLQHVMRAQQVDAGKILTQVKAHPYALDYENESPDLDTRALHDKAKKADITAMRDLLAKGVKVDAADTNRCTALHHAVKLGIEDSARFLIENHANINAKGSEDKTPLHFAIATESLSMVKLLMDAGASPSEIGSRGLAPLHFAVRNGNPVISRLIIDKTKPGEIDTRDASGRTALMHAAARGDAATLQLLLDKGTDINAKDQDGKSVLHYAAEQGDLATIKLLIDRGADLTALNKNNNTILHSAAIQNNPELMTLLIKQNKIDINAANNQGDTALHIAAKAGTGGNDQSIQSLLASGAKVNIQNQASQTALHYAAENNAVNATKVLLDKGADSTIRDKDGKQPVDLVARVKGNEEILEILSKATKSIEERGFAPTLIPEDVLTQALVKGLEASKQHEHSADKSSKDTAHEGSKPVAPTIHPTIPLELKKAAAAIGHEIAEASKKATATDASQSQQSRDGITH